MYNLLQVSFGPVFDRIYVSQQLDANQELLATVEGYAGHSRVPQLQAFAQQTVPAVRDHLAKLRSIRMSVAVNGRDGRE
jgi:predicted outer membrane protein